MRAGIVRAIRNDARLPWLTEGQAQIVADIVIVLINDELCMLSGDMGFEVAKRILDERERVLAVVNSTPRAALDDGRDLVVRTDIIRKVEHA